MLLPKNLFIVVFTCFLFLACTDTNESYQNELQKYLVKNIELNQSRIKRLNNKRLILKQEKPSTKFPNFKFIDSLHTVTKNSIDSSIKYNRKLNSQTINNYKTLKDTIFSLRNHYTQNKEKGIINESIILKDTSNNLFNSLLYLNDTESVFYQYLEHIFYKPLNYIGCGFNIVKVKCDISKDSTELILSNPFIQQNTKDRLILIGKITPEVYLDYSFARIKIGELTKGKHLIKGKVRYLEYGKEIDIPFEKEIEIK